MTKTKNAAQQLAAEPLEILKTAQEMLSPTKLPVPDNSQTPVPQVDTTKQTQKDTRTLQALEQEIKDMSTQRLMDDLARRIDSGEEIFVEGIIGLSDNQKQVLKQRQGLVAEQKAMMAQPKAELIQTSKRGRRFGANKKDVAKREETRVEKPTPTSG